MAFLGADTPMAQAIRGYDWHSTPLGAIAGWPVSLKTVVGLIINSHFPQCVVWGPGLITIPNDAFLPILGNKTGALGRSFADVWSEAWVDIGPIAERAFAGVPTYIENFAMLTDRHGAPEQAHFTFCYSPIRDETGAVVGMLDTVTETSMTVRADQKLQDMNGQLQTLNKELGHRLKNMLAVTQSVTLQTIRRANSLQHAREAISERLAALGQATDVLTADSWDAADLETLARATLSGHGLERIEIAGPPVRLSSQRAIALALALHELATNASKYGALSCPQGRVQLGWQVNVGPDTDGARFRLQWTEAGGPPVSPPTTKGFGSTLIERTLRSAFRGEVVMTYRPEGLAVELRTSMALGL